MPRHLTAVRDTVAPIHMSGLCLDMSYPKVYDAEPPRFSVQSWCIGWRQPDLTHRHTRLPCLADYTCHGVPASLHLAWLSPTSLGVVSRHRRDHTKGLTIANGGRWAGSKRAVAVTAVPAMARSAARATTPRSRCGNSAAREVVIRLLT